MLTRAERSLISRPGSNESIIDTIEPGAISVTDLYVDEQDTNRLARGDLAGTVVEVRDGTRVTNIPTALGIETWEEPIAAANPTYPHNHVRQYPNGLLEEWDDTPNNVRYHRYHPSGTYVETDSEGNEVRKIVGDGYLIIEKHGFVYIKGNCNLTVDGACNIKVLNNCNLEVNGQLNGLIKNDINITTNGCMNLNVKETFKIRADNFIVESSKYNQRTLGNHNLSVGETLNTITKARKTTIELQDQLKIGTAYRIESASVHFNILGPITAQATDTFSLQASALQVKGTNDVNIEGNAVNVKGNGPVKISGSAIDIKSDGEVAIEGTTAGLSGSSQTVLGGGTLNIVPAITKATSQSGGFLTNVLPTPSPAPTADSASSAAPATPTVPDPQTAEALASGLIIPGDRSSTAASPTIIRSFPSTRFSRLAIENDGGAPSAVPLFAGYNRPAPYVGSATSTTVPSDNPGRAVQVAAGAPARVSPVELTTPYIESGAMIVPSMRISQNFFLRDLSTAAAFPHQIVAQHGLTEHDIAVNLQYVAVNILDKLVERYGRQSFVITSGFRPEETNRSQHGRGQAVDIQFRDINIDQYPERAQEIIGTVPFDQMLLEYQSARTGRPWIHISFNRANNRYEYATFYNHRPASAFARL